MIDDFEGSDPSAADLAYLFQSCQAVAKITNALSQELCDDQSLRL